MTLPLVRLIARAAACTAALVLACSAFTIAQEKKDEDKGSRVAMVLPLAVTPGSIVTIKVRGVRLSEASEVRFPGAKPDIKAVVKSKGKAEMPQGAEAKDVGDTQVEVELAVPKETPAGAISFVVVTPAGETNPQELVVVEAASLVQEKEPNDGFRQAQEITVGKTVQGNIQSGEDVDVFRFDGKSGHKLVAEVIAARRGSALDSLLTLYDAGGHVIASNDDGDAQGDSILRFTCPADGHCFLALTDANSRGGAAHPYLLTLKAAE